MYELGPVDVTAIEALLKEREKSNEVPKALLQLRVDAAEKNRHHKFQLVCQVRLNVYFVTTIRLGKTSLENNKKLTSQADSLA